MQLDACQFVILLYIIFCMVPINIVYCHDKFCVTSAKHSIQPLRTTLQNFPGDITTPMDGINDLWCSSTVWMQSIQILMGKRVYGALVLFGCYQHRSEWKVLWCSSAVWLLSTQAPLLLG